MKHYKVLVSFLIILAFVNCKKNVSDESALKELKQEKLVIDPPQKEKIISSKCLLTKSTIKAYNEKLKSIYLNSSNDLQKELRTEVATKYSSEIKSILKSVYNSEFKVETKFEIDASNCRAEIYYITDDEIERGGEIYNIESSVILSLSIIDSEIKITSIVMAG